MTHLLKAMAGALADLLPRGRAYWILRMWSMSGDRGTCPHCGFLISHQESTVRRAGRPHHHICACVLEGFAPASSVDHRSTPPPAAELVLVKVTLEPCGHTFHGKADVEHTRRYVARAALCPLCPLCQKPASL